MAWMNIACALVIVLTLDGLLWAQNQTVRSGGHPNSPASAEQDQPKTAAQEPAKAASKAPVADPAQLKAIIDTELDQMKVDDVLKRVARAHAVLSRNGQAALRDRATVRLARDQANCVISRLQFDPKVAEAADLLKADTVQAELAKVAEIQEENQQAAAFAEFLKKNNIERASLMKLAELRVAENAVVESEKVLKSIENYLDRSTIPFTVSASGGLFQATDKIAAVGKKYATEGEAVPGETAGPVAPGGPGDIKTLLRALLGRPAAAK